MKKIIFILALGLVTLFTSSCTEQIRARAFGGELTIQVPKGQRLTMATWKESNLFYLYEEMDSDYIPKTKMFVESSAYGVLETKITFIESR